MGAISLVTTVGNGAQALRFRNRYSLDRYRSRPYDHVPLPVPNTNRPLPFQCPKCQHEGCLLIVKSLTVMTWTCDSCRHTWATDMASLPDDVQKRIPQALNDR